MAKADDLKAKMGMDGAPLQHIPAAPPNIPDHEMIRCIGQGSFGEVWLARNAVGTWRAVKVVRRARFKDARPYEREFSGLQKYEPISRSNDGLMDVLQIGRNHAEGYFYYVMELADDANVGQASSLSPLSQAGNPSMGTLQPGQKAFESETAGKPVLQFDPATYVPKTLAREIHARGRLSVEECITLGLTLNLALGHLHRSGLIHRDIKPSNIIFMNGVAKLADIGLVTELAEAESVWFTEGFSPPEGPNSPQADLYALGKVLYEASMGKDRQEFPEPFTALGTDADSMALMELNTVLLKACAPNPRQRYQSAEEMNADLALLHSGRSVRDKHALERRLKIMTRVAVAIVAVMLLGVVPYYLAIKESRRARTEARKSHETARFLVSMLEGVGPSAAKGRDTAMLREILDKTAERIGQDLKTEPEVEADIRIILGKTYSELGLVTNALAMTQEALRLRRLHLGPEHTAIADALNNLGAQLYDVSDYAGAANAASEALAMRLKLLGNEHINVALSLNNLGLALWNQGKHAESEEAHRRSLAIRKKLLPSDHPHIAMSLVNLGIVQWMRGEFAGVEANFGEALQLFKKAGNEPACAVVQANLATALARKGELAAAEAMHLDTLALRKRLFQGDHPQLEISLTQLGLVLVARGDLEGAEARLKEALAMQERLRFDKHADVADALAGLGTVFTRKGDWTAAEEKHQQALAIRMEILKDEDNPDAVDSLDALGVLAIARGDFDDAQQKFLKAVKAAKKMEGNDYPAVIAPLWHLGWVLGQNEDQAGSEASNREALAISIKHGPYGAWPLVRGIYDVAEILQAQRKFDEAERLLLDAAEYIQKSARGGNLQRDMFQRLAQFYEAWGKTAEAADCRKKLAELNPK